jgi:hypothetical protein
MEHFYNVIINLQDYQVSNKEHENFFGETKTPFNLNTFPTNEVNPETGFVVELIILEKKIFYENERNLSLVPNIAIF